MERQLSIGLGGHDGQSAEFTSKPWRPLTRKLKISVGILSPYSVIDHHMLPCLLNLLTTNHKKSIKKEACWTSSNIIAGNQDQIQVKIILQLVCYMQQRRQAQAPVAEAEQQQVKWATNISGSGSESSKYPDAPGPGARPRRRSWSRRIAAGALEALAFNTAARGISRRMSSTESWR